MTVTFESSSIKAWQTCRSPEQPFFGTTIATNVGWTPCLLRTTLIFVPRRAWVPVHKIADAFSTAGVFSTGTGTEGVGEEQTVRRRWYSSTLMSSSSCRQTSLHTPTTDLQPRAFSGAFNVTACSSGEPVLERQAVPNSRLNQTK